MKKLLLLLSFGTSIFSFAQFKVYTVDVSANDIVYDKLSNKIYASLPSSNGTNGNSIGIVNLDTYKLENTVYMGSEPTVLAISDDGKYVYSGFDGASIVRRFDIVNKKADLQFSLGADSFLGSYYTEDLEVMPGKSNTIAVSRYTKTSSPRHGGVAIYDDNVMRSTVTDGHTGANRIEFMNSNSIIGYNNETTEFGIRRLSVNNAGASTVATAGNVLTGFNLDFSYSNNRMYAYDGKVVDLTTQPFVIGQYQNVNGPVVYDATTNKACFASYDGNGNISFKRFNSDTFLITDNLPISQSFGRAGTIITCGTGCYAFNTSDNKIVIIKDQNLEISNQTLQAEVQIYPNPTSDYATIKSESKIEKAELFDLQGRLIYFSTDNIQKIDLRKYPIGNYILKLHDSKGNITTKKILKK